MHEGALRFWEIDTWRAWIATRKTWREYRTARKRWLKRKNRVVSDLDRCDRSKGEVLHRISLADSVGETGVPFETRGSEVGLAILPGVTLFEQRSRNRQLVWVPVGPGTLYFTNRRMVFLGAKKVAFRYDKLTLVEKAGRSLHLGVSNRKRIHRVVGNIDDLLVLLQAVEDYTGHLNPADRYTDALAEVEGSREAHQADLEQVKSELAALHAPEVPLSPAWAVGGLLLLLTTAGLVVASLMDGGPPRRADTASVVVPPTAAGFVQQQRGEGTPSRTRTPSSADPSATDGVGSSNSRDTADSGPRPTTTSSAPVTPESSTDGIHNLGTSDGSEEDPTAAESGGPEQTPSSTTTRSTPSSQAPIPATTSTTAAPIASTTTSTTSTTATAPVDPEPDCDSSYPTVCIPSPPPDLDCGEIAFRNFAVVGSDPHRFDRDHDGIGCES